MRGFTNRYADASMGETQQLVLAPAEPGSNNGVLGPEDDLAERERSGVA
jgi:hypothetical protein